MPERRLESSRPALLVLGSQLTEFEEDLNRLDVLAIDERGEIVLLELKVDEKYRVSDLQALAYAAAYANQEPRNFAETLRRSMTQRGEVTATLEEAKDRIARFVGKDFENWEPSQYVRIKVIAPAFPTRVLATIRWLRELHGNAAVQISADHGESWTEPPVIAKMLPAATLEPNSGTPVRSGDVIPDAAVDPSNGNLFVAWMDARFSHGAYNDIALAVSSDGGHTWTGPVAVSRPLSQSVADPNRQAFAPQVHVSADGRLAVSYYDFRHNDGADGDTETDYFLSQCSKPDATEPDLCAGQWEETRVTAESFDLRRAPQVIGGLFLGDYFGLTDVPGAFATAFAASAVGDPATTYYSTVPFLP